ncbi:hypothetical protein BP00DRAFT_411093 [Aspergillus indologenus CBS 114.80]|uniref:Uncharacterized protein n=1 Tax=Aspergillus indologenus CBS 114.80 TaxID=1450541 RepID=A0A2V5JIY5_9EURO|nr:hypothetical protein BP00DRAFT_411093 [Aspergillus indologenus CBS 114.80]
MLSLQALILLFLDGFQTVQAQGGPLPCTGPTRACAAHITDGANPTPPLTSRLADCSSYQAVVVTPEPTHHNHDAGRPRPPRQRRRATSHLDPDGGADLPGRPVPRPRRLRRSVRLPGRAAHDHDAGDADVDRLGDGDDHHHGDRDADADRLCRPDLRRLRSHAVRPGRLRRVRLRPRPHRGQLLLRRLRLPPGNLRHQRRLPRGLALSGGQLLRVQYLRPRGAGGGLLLGVAAAAAAAAAGGCGGGGRPDGGELYQYLAVREWAACLRGQRSPTSRGKEVRWRTGWRTGGEGKAWVTRLV